MRSKSDKRTPAQFLNIKYNTTKTWGFFHPFLICLDFKCRNIKRFYNTFKNLTTEKNARLCLCFRYAFLKPCNITRVYFTVCKHGKPFYIVK